LGDGGAQVRARAGLLRHRASNDRLAEIVELRPQKFDGFAHHEPFRENAVVELERAVRDLGLRGHRVLTSTLDRPIADPAGHEAWEVCADHQIPVLIHFGILGAGGGIPYHRNIISPSTCMMVPSSSPMRLSSYPTWGVAASRAH
jgi:predicted TIM-barrel fold metal-dependent hydrolase